MQCGLTAKSLLTTIMVNYYTPPFWGNSETDGEPTEDINNVTGRMLPVYLQHSVNKMTNSLII